MPTSSGSFRPPCERSHPSDWLGILIVLASILLFPVQAHCQSSAPPTLPSTYPARESPAMYIDYASGSNPVYICYANPSQPVATWTKAATTLTNVSVSTNVGTVTTSTAHGLQAGNKVTISGVVADTDLNASYIIQTIGSSTTFTITTANVGDATYTDSGLVMTTNAPRLIDPIWSITYLTYSGSNVESVKWSNGASGRYDQKCSSRAISGGAIEYR